jgi:hypothetical protein
VISLTRQQITALGVIADTLEPDSYGSVCAIAASDAYIEVELRDSGGDYGRRYTRYIAEDGSWWRYDDGKAEPMVAAHLTPERGSYESTYPTPRTVHYVY